MLLPRSQSEEAIEKRLEPASYDNANTTHSSPLMPGRNFVSCVVSYGATRRHSLLNTAEGIRMYLLNYSSYTFDTNQTYLGV